MRLRNPLPTWQYADRRWSDLPQSSRFDMVRRFLTAAWPFLASLAAMAVVAAALMVIGSLADADRERELAQERLEEIAEDLLDVSASNARLLGRSDPCLPGDPPESERCVRKAESDRMLAAALAVIKADQENQHAHLGDRIEELIRRPPAGTRTIERTPVLPPPSVSPAPVAPRPVPTTPATTAPTPTAPAPTAPAPPPSTRRPVPIPSLVPSLPTAEPEKPGEGKGRK